MKYDQKIQLLESRLAELDNELKIIEAVAKETWDSFIMIHEKIESHHNKVDSLQIEAKELMDSNKNDAARKKLLNAQNVKEYGQHTLLRNVIKWTVLGVMIKNLERYKEKLV